MAATGFCIDRNRGHGPLLRAVHAEHLPILLALIAAISLLLGRLVLNDPREGNEVNRPGQRLT